MKLTSVGEDMVIEVLMQMAKEYKANMKPADGIIRFVLPKEDINNPAGQNVMVEIDIHRKMAKMTNVKH